MTEAKLRKLEKEAKAAKNESGVSVLFTHELEELLAVYRWALTAKDDLEKQSTYKDDGGAEGHFGQNAADLLAIFPHPPEERGKL